MSSALREGFYSRLQIIGTTTPVDRNRLPQRLSPIYRPMETLPVGSFHCTPEHVLLPIDERGSELPHLGIQPLSWFEEETETENSEGFATPIQARADCALVQLEPDQPPVLIPEAELGAALDRHYEDLLIRVAEKLQQDNPEEALRMGLRALRAAGPRNSIPRLLVMGLSKEHRSREESEWLKQEILLAFTESQLNQDWIEFSASVLYMAKKVLAPTRRWVEKGLNALIGASVPNASAAPLPSRPAYFRADRRNAQGNPNAWLKMASSYIEHKAAIAA